MEKKTNFGERLGELLFYNNKTPEMLSESINVNNATVYRWKNNKTDISLSNLIRVAKYFNCSLDFLLGRSDDITNFKIKRLMPFSIRIREIMKERNISTYKLRQISRYDGKYFQKWDRGTDAVSSTLIELAVIFECSIDYLISRED